MEPVSNAVVGIAPQVEGRRGNRIRVSDGSYFWPLDQRPEEVSIDVIAHALSQLCRFGGHCSRFYSVAEHSVRVSRECHRDHALWGLLHDASEAYLVDIPRPVKLEAGMDWYRQVEAGVMRAVCERFGLVHATPGDVVRADNVLLATEARDLMGAPQDWYLPFPPLEERLTPWEPAQAKWEFRDAFFRLARGRDI